MNRTWGLIIGSLVLLVGIVLIVLVMGNDNSHPTFSTTSESIPVIVEPDDGDLSGSNDAGATLQQPGSFSGQIDGATDLQGAATFNPDELNNLVF